MEIVRIIRDFFQRDKKRVFLDFASSTFLRKEVDLYMQNFKDVFYNPSSIYLEGRVAKDLLDKAKSSCASFLNCSKDNIVFTSGGTESNNLFIFGVIKKAKENGIQNPHIISSKIEHPSTIEVLNECANFGAEVTFLDAGEDGIVSVSDVVSSLKENTVLVSLMYVNNEIGTVNDIKDIGLAIKKWKEDVCKNDLQKKFSYPYFYSDCCQAPLYFNIDSQTFALDGLSIDSIKIFGPKGVGLMFVRKNVSISPIIFGGGQERGLRSGTENYLSALGFSKALQLAKKERVEVSLSVSKMRDYLKDEVLKNFPEVKVNGSLKSRSPNNINFCMKVSGKYLDSEYLTVVLDTFGVCVSYSSSCRTLKEDSSSYVVESLGQKECGSSSLRFSLSKYTKKDDIDFAISALKKAVKQVCL